jgi:hypothetical protein
LSEKIKADDRHKRLHVIHDQENPERGFKGWNVVFASMESIDKSKQEGISDFLDKKYTHELAKANPALGAQIIRTCQDIILMF